MIIGVPGETASDEERVALVPPVAAELIADGHDIYVGAGVGETADWSDEAYESVGCTVLGNREDVFEQADIILQVRALGATDDASLDTYRENQLVVGLLGPYDIDDATLAELAERNVSAFALELIPRISRAQSMDALSSMASLGGYKATLVAATELPKMFPLEMTAAGTIRPAEVFIIGAGVAGLKAISTAERLGASVRAYDIRLEVKQEVESLGADFVELDLETEGAGDEEGYAIEMGEEFLEQQRKKLTRVVADSDVVITTAAIPGRPAPELVTTEMIENMDAGSVIIDLSAESGGNCEPTVADERIDHDGVTILGPTDLPSTVTHTASEQFANNMKNFLQNMVVDGTFTIDTTDEIVDSTLLTHDGEIRNPHIQDEPPNTDDSGDKADKEASETEGTDAE
ncbi:Re/Si-specific NAD(P)(+) transhydrogenase subunit alpha [Salinibaculum salinum]|uniref:Re/Si-specific NAD(P)(+) transhydrogenase subunit alpha n=1 Tax=Salinibaculum salinum TaxID=3131996 RepID=UPI0030EB5102